jgi:hypothetical protein
VTHDVRPDHAAHAAVLYLVRFWQGAFTCPASCFLVAAGWWPRATVVQSAFIMLGVLLMLMLPLVWVSECRMVVNDDFEVQFNESARFRRGLTLPPYRFRVTAKPRCGRFFVRRCGWLACCISDMRLSLHCVAGRSCLAAGSGSASALRNIGQLHRLVYNALSYDAMFAYHGLSGALHTLCCG